jgi:hypothetical protein
LITNFNIRILDLLDIEHEFFISTDANNINADSFIIKNTIAARDFFENIIDLYPKYKDHGWAEQQVIIDLLKENENFNRITKILPQKTINSYDYSLYPDSNFHGSQDSLTHFKLRQDYYGNNGQWSQGDFLIHWPGTILPQRINLTKKYIPLIIK